MRLLEYLKFIRLFGFKKLISIARAHRFAQPILRGYFTYVCLTALRDTNILCKLKYPGSLIAELSDYNKENIEVIFEYLQSINLLKKKKARYFIENSIFRNLEDSLGAFLFAKAYSPLILEIPNLLKMNNANQQKNLRDEDCMVLASAVTEKLVPYPIVYRVIEKHCFKRVLDVGCGSCSFLIDLCSMYKDIEAIGLDISDDIIKSARQRISHHHLEGRIELHKLDAASMSGDQFTRKPGVITFMFVLHELLGESNRDGLIDLLQKISSFFPDSKLAICELDKRSPEYLARNPSLLAEHFLYHGLSNQKIQPASEWEKIFLDAKFKIIENIKFPFLGQAFYLLEK